MRPLTAMTSDERDTEWKARGRDARAPSDLPMRGWKEVAGRVWRQITLDHVSLLAAGVAFYAMLALVPALIALVSLYGLIFDPADLQAQMDTISGGLPWGVRDILDDQLGAIVSKDSGGLSIGLIVGLVGAWWSAGTGMTGLIEAVNTAYNEKETRSFFRLRVMAFLATLIAVVLVIVAVLLVAAVPTFLQGVGLGSIGATVVAVARWPALAAIAMVGMAAIYRYGPDRREAKWRWVTWGSTIATVLWLASSVGFSIYLSNFGNYQETYGSLGAVVVLLLWLFLTAWVILIGAEINAELEHQTACDSTRGRERPMGERGAFVADHLPEGRAATDNR